MFRNKKALLLIASILITITILCFQKSPQKTVVIEKKQAIDSTLIKLKADFQDYEKILEEGIQGCKCPGAAVVIIKDTSIIMIKGFGTTRVNGTDSINAHTVFRLGSLSKGFAAITSGILVDKGYFSFEDKVVDYFPEFELKSKEQSGRIEINHILSHTTGLPRHAYTNLIEEGWSIKKIAALLKEVDLTNTEGERYAYQNATYSLIEEVIKSATKRNYSTILKKEIFQKCNMADASCSFEALKLTTNKAFPHAIVAKNYKYAKTRITKKYYNSVSSGGVNASISDMANWLQLLLGNRPDIISDTTLNHIFKPLIKTSYERRFYDRWKSTNNSFYAKGWRVLNFNNRNIMYHGGYVNGYRSEIAFDRKNKIAICALFNAPCKYSNDVVRDLFDFYDSQINIELKQEPSLAEN